MNKCLLSLILCPLLAASACGGDEDSTLKATWTFKSGTCTTNDVETVRVTWGPKGGTTQDVDFPCTDGSGTLGTISGDGSYSVKGQGLDAKGITRAESYGTSVSLSGGGMGSVPVHITLSPKSANVVVSWSITGGGVCPKGMTIPYFITLYGAPANKKVSEKQVTCSAGTATLERVAPGDYVVEVDSRAVSPALKAAAPVSVKAGEDANVSVQL